MLASVFDTILAFLVLFAVILLIALTVTGNERQYRAILSLREAYNRWAEGDLKVKRAQVAKNITVADPVKWLDDVATAIFGTTPAISTLHPWDGGGEAVALVATCDDGRKLIVTPALPERFRKAVTIKKMRGRGASALADATSSILGDKPKKVPVIELNVVSAGSFFDIEASQVWEKKFGKPLGTDRLFLFEVPSRRSA